MLQQGNFLLQLTLRRIVAQLVGCYSIYFVSRLLFDVLKVLSIFVDYYFS